MTERPARHTVDVWNIDLRPDAERVEAALEVLTADETGAVERVVEPHRSRRLMARAALRTVVSGYLDQPPADVTFAYGPSGKPRVAGRPAAFVEFNLSTSGDVCLVAVSRTVPLGVDVEVVRPLPDAGRIAGRFFAAAEVEALGGAGGTDVRRFLRYWTAKEAYVKGVGTGLSLPLDEIVVPRELEQQERVALSGRHGEGWSLVLLDPAPDTVATLAANAPPEALDVVVRELEPR